MNANLANFGALGLDVWGFESTKSSMMFACWTTYWAEEHISLIAREMCSYSCQVTVWTWEPPWHWEMLEKQHPAVWSAAHYISWILKYHQIGDKMDSTHHCAPRILANSTDSTMKPYLLLIDQHESKKTDDIALSPAVNGVLAMVSSLGQRRSFESRDHRSCGRTTTGLNSKWRKVGFVKLHRKCIQVYPVSSCFKSNWMGIYGIYGIIFIFIIFTAFWFWTAKDVS